jgi:hypothetical protein
MDPASGFAVESYTHRSVTLRWDDPAGAAFHRIYFGESGEFSAASLFCPVLQGVGRAIIGALKASTPYWFWIVSEDADGNLAPAAEAQCETKAGPGEDFDFESVKAAVYEWAVDNFGDFAVVWGKTNGTRPGKPFVALSMSGPMQEGGEDHVRGGSRLCGNRFLTVTVDVISKTDAMQMASDLRTSLQRPDVVDFFDARNIGVGAAGPITDVSDLLDASEWERRAQFDFGIVVASDKTFDSGEIAEVIFDKTLGR